jgi:hypothetical protein
VGVSIGFSFVACGDRGRRAEKMGTGGFSKCKKGWDIVSWGCDGLGQSDSGVRVQLMQDMR